MSLRAVLDANVLVPIALCDALLHLAEAEVFDHLCSGRILAETRVALVSDLATTARRGSVISAPS